MRFLQRFMYGRYGVDYLAKFTFTLYMIVFVSQMIIRRTPAANTVAYPILSVISWMLIIYNFYRMFSRNIYKRQQENQKFLNMIKPISSYFKFLRLKFQERNGVKRLYRCAKCKQIIRVPKGKGKIAITCPKCRFEFIKKS